MSTSEASTEIRFGDEPYFVFCDHAANNIPDDLNCLGLPEDLLQTHIAWDIGAAAVAEQLAKSFSGTFLRCEFSRLVIDPNRDLTSKDIIPANSDQIPIPGNQMLNEKDRKTRISRFHEPYHKRLGAIVDKMCTHDKPPFVISIHSFTNRLMGASDERPWPIGFLWREDEPSARALIEFLKNRTGWSIGDNKPYDARQFNYSVDRHIGPRGLSHLTIEVRQDMIANETGVVEIAALLEEGIKSVAHAIE